MNAIMQRWVRTCRRELLDCALICNQRHLLHALRKYERFYNLVGAENSSGPLTWLFVAEPDRVSRVV